MMQQVWHDQSKDYTTHSSLTNAQVYAQILGNRLRQDLPEITNTFMQGLLLGALWYDVGKQFIPRSLLSSKNALTEDEFDLIQTHTISGYEYLTELELGWQGSIKKHILDCVLYHHERYNGQGYPYQLATHQIPLVARIIALVDVFDALTSERSYKPAFSFEKAYDIIVAQRGQQFDPIVVDAFIDTRQAFYRNLILNKGVA